MKNGKTTGFSNPTLAEIAIEIGGERFRLSFDFAALAVAKDKLRKHGVEMNILRSLDFSQMDVDTVPALFFAAAQKHQAGLTWERAQQLVNLRTVAPIFAGIAEAYKLATVEPKANPRKANLQN